MTPSFKYFRTAICTLMLSSILMVLAAVSDLGVAKQRFLAIRARISDRAASATEQQLPRVASHQDASSVRQPAPEQSIARRDATNSQFPQPDQRRKNVFRHVTIQESAPPGSAGQESAAPSQRRASSSVQLLQPQEAPARKSEGCVGNFATQNALEESDSPSTDLHITFQNVSSPARESVDSSRIETRLSSLQHQIERLAQAESDRQSTALEQAARIREQDQQNVQLQTLQQRIDQIALQTERNTPAVRQDQPPPVQNPDSETVHKAEILKVNPTSDGTERFSLDIQDEQIARVLEMLGQLSGTNILVGQGVSGTVSARLENVTAEQALAGILRSMGFAYQHEGEFVFVMTQADAEARKNVGRKLITKIYRPLHVSVEDVQALVRPLLTKADSAIAMTAPSEIGIASGAEKAGAAHPSQHAALLVRDYSDVIQEIDGVLKEIDVPPMQVVIEAVILSVRLNHEQGMGVNFALLSEHSPNLVVCENDQIFNGTGGFPGATDGTLIPQAGQLMANADGLQYGLIQCDVSDFLSALEQVADTNLIASPRFRVLNKQKAELIMGEKLGYRTQSFQDNQTIENIEFLAVGTKLLLRPFIAPDGLVRMEIHPERSCGAIDSCGLPRAVTTEVTTNVLVRDGSTVVISGLIDEEVTEIFDRVPLLSALPVVGSAFRHKTKKIVRNELIILITPRIVVEPVDLLAGESIMIENNDCAEPIRNKSMSISGDNLSRRQYERVPELYERGEAAPADRHDPRAALQGKNNREELRVRDQVEQALGEQTADMFRLPVIHGLKNERSVP